MITSSRNPQVQSILKLSKRGVREKQKRFVIEGPSGIAEAFRSGVRVDSITFRPPVEGKLKDLETLASRSKISVFEVSPAIMERLTGTTSPQGALAVAPFIDRTLEDVLTAKPTLVVVIAGVRDPGNTGTILRSCWAAGVGGVLILKESADVYNPKVVRSSAGALFNLKFARDLELPFVMQELSRYGYNAIATDAKSTRAYWDVDLTPPTALIMGNEAWGLSDEALSASHDKVGIPLSGSAESLNVAVACSLLLFEAVRQRRPSS